MAHYALLDENLIVKNVIVGQDENDPTQPDWEQFYKDLFDAFMCKRTSYNANIRGVFAQPGFSYDPDFDIFLAPKPYPSWVFDVDIKTWTAPTPRPSLSEGQDCDWDEAKQEWIILTSDKEAPNATDA